MDKRDRPVLERRRRWRRRDDQGYIYGNGGGGVTYAYNTYPTLLSGSYEYYVGAGGGGGPYQGNGGAGGNTIWNYDEALKIFMLPAAAAV